MSPVSPALAGGFCTAEPPGKPLLLLHNRCTVSIPFLPFSDIQGSSAVNTDKAMGRKNYHLKSSPAPSSEGGTELGGHIHLLA